ncbi:hypothetical protein KCU99_g6518, partial [Aureobasidium melanogenum]
MSETITHVVLFKYRPDITWSDFEKHFESFMALKTKSLNPKTGKPLIMSLKAGKNRSWEPFNKGFTHGFVLEFENQEDLNYYLTQEPVHIEFSRNAGPLIEDSCVIDIKDGILFGPPADRPLSQDEYQGSCHCGGINWTARLSTAEHVLCHCSTCQKLGGGPYSCNQIIPRDDLRILSGTPNVYTYTGASGIVLGKSVRCFFCGTCTSHIYHHQDVMPDKIIVRTLLLEGGPQMPATGEIFGEGRLSWVRELQNSLSQ